MPATDGHAHPRPSGAGCADKRQVGHPDRKHRAQPQPLPGRTAPGRHYRPSADETPTTQEGLVARPGRSSSNQRPADTAQNGEIYDLLVRQRGWPAERYGQFVGQALIAALLPPEATRTDPIAPDRPL